MADLALSQLLFKLINALQRSRLFFQQHPGLLPLDGQRVLQRCLLLLVLLLIPNCHPGLKTVA